MKEEKKNHDHLNPWSKANANYRDRNPTKREQWDLNAARNKLVAAGYTVISPEKPEKT